MQKPVRSWELFAYLIPDSKWIRIYERTKTGKRTHCLRHCPTSVRRLCWYDRYVILPLEGSAECQGAGINKQATTEESKKELVCPSHKGLSLQQSKGEFE
ncbi:hypothetical protein JOB18_039207 [Solea senegalensis]|uniref:Uncharacterized protein n=1 Tax=Solea senegalensis TaxID=28829 RepID=A0AAV6Q785_SOLSE|nr:hypothetical protein JOB18_039207 [Solea senegalensis]